MSTVARPITSDSAHFYTRDGQAMHTVIAKGTGLPRQTTLADAKKLGLLPSVSGILRVLDKPALNTWKVEQAILAVLSTPRVAGEEMDAFVKRVLSVDAEAEGQKARDFGTLIHSQLENALQAYFLKPTPTTYDTDSDTEPFVRPVLDLIASLGKVVATERIVVGEGYAGTLDALIEKDGLLTVLDFKTTKSAKLPIISYTEHRLALSAYAAAITPHFPDAALITTANIYISSVTPGMISMSRHIDWHEVFEKGFKPILAYWRWANCYAP